MKNIRKYYKHLMLSMLIIGMTSASSCIDYDDSASDLGYYQPYIYAQYNWLNLSSLSDTLQEHNISHKYQNPQSKDQQDLRFNFLGNVTYVFSNISYKMLALTSVGFHNDQNNEHSWMTIDFSWRDYEYRYFSREEALNATYLLEPSWNLTKYFLNESSNPMPDKIEYRVRF